MIILNFIIPLEFFPSNFNTISSTISTSFSHFLLKSSIFSSLCKSLHLFIHTFHFIDTSLFLNNLTLFTCVRFKSTFICLQFILNFVGFLISLLIPIFISSYFMKLKISILTTISWIPRSVL